MDWDSGGIRRRPERNCPFNAYIVVARILYSGVRYSTILLYKYELLTMLSLPYKTARSRTIGSLADTYTCRTLARSGSGPGRSRRTLRIRPHPAIGLV